MDDMISRQAAIDALRDYLVGKRCPDDGTLTCRLIENEVINKLPPIQPKRGKWLPDNNNYIYEQYVCSECKNSFKVDTRKGKPMWNFCPNCGAKMVRRTDG